MRIFITGVGCVGKTTIGSILSSRLGYCFFDLDEEVERFFGTSIERLQNKFLTIRSYRNEAAKALVDILAQPNSRDCVIALPPSGLMGGFLSVVKKTPGTSVVLTDTPENILNRITFYDIDSRLIKKDITYFRKTYDRADMQVDISGLNAEESSEKVERSLEAVLEK